MTPPGRSRAVPFSSNDPAAEPALAVETERLRQILRRQQPEELAQLVGGIYTSQSAGAGTLWLDLWSKQVVLDFPDLIARPGPGGGVPLPLPVQALLMFYLSTSDGVRPAGDWVSFGDLPGGRTYAQAFEGYSGKLLVRAFGENLAAFQSASLSAGGTQVDLADAAFGFAALPHVPLLVAYWQGEDEIPSASRVLFDQSATHHLPIDVCAILGGMLVSRILKAWQVR